MARIDYYYDNNAPVPNSIKPAAAVAIFDDQERLLLLRRKDNGKWTMPGGTLDFGESLSDCAIRETKEETNLDVELECIIGIYSDPNILIKYSDGEVRQEFTTVYLGKAKDTSNVVIDDESQESHWFKINEVNNLEFASSQLFRINDVIDYILKSRCILGSSLMPNKVIKEAYNRIKKCTGGWGKAPSPLDKEIQKCLKAVVQEMNMSNEEVKLLRRKIFNTGGIEYKEIPIQARGIKLNEKREKKE